MDKLNNRVEGDDYIHGHHGAVIFLVIIIIIIIIRQARVSKKKLKKTFFWSTTAKSRDLKYGFQYSTAIFNASIPSSGKV